MTEYILTVTETSNKAGKYHYQVIQMIDGQPGPVISERKSNRKSIACDIHGHYYFGRIDLVGKGDYARRNETTPIAYLEKLPVS